jgi:NADPH2:quinone reductase
VIAGAGTPTKRDIALALGADYAVEYRESGWTERVLELTEGRGVDVALQMNGPIHLGQTLGILAPFGRLISYGVVSGAVDGLDPNTLTPLLYDPAPSQVLTGFNLTIWFEHRLAEAVASLQRLVGWIASGQLRTPAVSSMPLGDAAEAHRLLETGATRCKVVLKP